MFPNHEKEIGRYSLDRTTLRSLNIPGQLPSPLDCRYTAGNSKSSGFAVPARTCPD